jgi:hypothetical protein
MSALGEMKGIPCQAPLFVTFLLAARVCKNVTFMCHSGTICDFVRLQVTSICIFVTTVY